MIWLLPTYIFFYKLNSNLVCSYKQQQRRPMHRSAIYDLVITYLHLFYQSNSNLVCSYKKQQQQQRRPMLV